MMYTQVSILMAVFARALFGVLPVDVKVYDLTVDVETSIVLQNCRYTATITHKVRKP